MSQDLNEILFQGSCPGDIIPCVQSLLQILYLVFTRGYAPAVDVDVPVLRRRTREEGACVDGTVTPEGDEEGAVEWIVDELTLATAINYAW